MALYLTDSQGHPLPYEYLEYVLCQEWHCTPVELAQVPYWRIHRYLVVKSAVDLMNSVKQKR